MLRTAGDDPTALAPAVRATVKELDPTMAVAGLTTMSALVSGSVALPRFLTLCITAFGALALLLAAVFGALYVALIDTTDLLDQQSRELVRASESIRVAQSLRNRLLAEHLATDAQSVAAETARQMAWCSESPLLRPHWPSSPWGC